MSIVVGRVGYYLMNNLFIVGMAVSLSPHFHEYEHIKMYYSYFLMTTVTNTNETSVELNNVHIVDVWEILPYE
jgi:hypothetical protein